MIDRRRDRPRDRQPRLRVGCRDRGEGGVAGRQDHRLRPAHPRRLRRLLRVVRQHQGRRAAGPGPGRLPRRQGREHRLPERFADRQQRHAVLGRCAQRARPDDQLQDRRRAGRSGLGQRAGGHHLRAALHRRPTARSTASTPPTTASAGAVISILEKNGVDGEVPVTGQDATVEGLQNILAGTSA